MSMFERVSSRTLALVLGTVLLAAWATAASWTSPLAHDLWFWAAACLLGELLWVRLPVGQATLSMASAVHFATLLVLPRGQAMAVIAAASLVAELGSLRKPPIRAAFNAAQTALAVGAASLALAAAAGGRIDMTEVLGRFWLWPLLPAAALYFAVNTGAVSLAVALEERIPPLRAWRANFGTGYELLSSGALFSLGALLAWHYTASGMAATTLVTLPLLVAYEGYRRHANAHPEPQAASQERRAA